MLCIYPIMCFSAQMSSCGTEILDNHYYYYYEQLARSTTLLCFAGVTEDGESRSPLVN